MTNLPPEIAALREGVASRDTASAVVAALANVRGQIDRMLAAPPIAYVSLQLADAIANDPKMADAMRDLTKAAGKAMDEQRWKSGGVSNEPSMLAAAPQGAAQEPKPTSEKPAPRREPVPSDEELRRLFTEWDCGPYPDSTARRLVRAIVQRLTGGES